MDQNKRRGMDADLDASGVSNTNFDSNMDTSEEIDSFNRKGVIKEPEEQLAHYGSDKPFRAPDSSSDDGSDHAREAPRVPTDSLTED